MSVLWEKIKFDQGKNDCEVTAVAAIVAAIKTILMYREAIPVFNQPVFPG